MAAAAPDSESTSVADDLMMLAAEVVGVVTCLRDPTSWTASVSGAGVTRLPFLGW